MIALWASAPQPRAQGELKSDQDVEQLFATAKDGMTPDDFVLAADEEHKKAKESGRDRVRADIEA